MLHLYLAVTIVLIVVLTQILTAPKRKVPSGSEFTEQDLAQMDLICRRLEERLETLERIARSQDGSA